MLSREWQELGQHTGPWPLTSQTRFVTGDVIQDAILHRVVILYGIELDFNSRFNEIKDYRIVDEQKYMLFVLRWS
jgi:CRISPR/Cas system CSM-associated protein Csm4 (group 5 of RAMP superfamily)